MRDTLNRREERELEILSRYFKIDNKKKVITIPFHFKKASDMFDQKIGEKKLLSLNEDTMRKIADIAERIPFHYKYDIHMTVDDYEDYKPSEIMQSIKDAFELFHYEFHDYKKGSQLKFVIFLIIGIALTGILVWLSIYGIFESDSILKATIVNILSLLPTLIFWEGFYELLWPNKTLYAFNYNLIKQLNEFRLLDKKLKVLKVMDQNKFLDGWQGVKRSQKWLSLSLLWSATIILVMVVLGILSSIDCMETQFIQDNAYRAELIVFVTLNSIFGIFASIVGFSLYVDRFRKLRRYSIIILSLLVLFSALFFTFGMLLFSTGTITPAIPVCTGLMLGFAIYLLICTAYLRKLEKVNKKHA